MKLVVSICLLLAVQISNAESLIGTWKYSSFFYDGQLHPILTPTLDLRFTFGEDGISILRWFEAGESGFCERKALYRIENEKILYQKVTWVNPDNHSSCSSDPDMQMGKESRTPFQIENSQLKFDLQLSGQPFIYIMDRIREMI